MNISVIILGIVLGGILTIVALIFAILALTQGKSQNAIIWGLSFVVAISILVLSIVQVVKRIGKKVEHGVEWAKEHNGSNLTYNDDIYKKERQSFLDTLQKYINENLKDKVPADFYDNVKVEKSEDNKITVPFVYPLSIKYDTHTLLGDFINDVNDSVFLKNISLMAFDENFAIVKTDNGKDPETLRAGHPEVEYILFDLRTREYLPFTNEQLLIEKANKIGYSGSSVMKSLSDDYKGWTDSSDLD